MSSGRPELSLKGRALRLLSMREHSRLELERKLSSHETREGELAEALDALTARGFISDERVADSLLHRRAGKLGASRVKAELQAKGLDEAVVREALSNAVRHSGADTVGVEISVDDNLTIVVTDSYRALFEISHLGNEKKWCVIRVADRTIVHEGFASVDDAQIARRMADRLSLIRRQPAVIHDWWGEVDESEAADAAQAMAPPLGARAAAGQRGGYSAGHCAARNADDRAGPSRGDRHRAGDQGATHRSRCAGQRNRSGAAAHRAPRAGARASDGDGHRASHHRPACACGRAGGEGTAHRGAGVGRLRPGTSRAAAVIGARERFGHAVLVRSRRQLWVAPGHPLARMRSPSLADVAAWSAEIAD